MEARQSRCPRAFQLQRFRRAHRCWAQDRELIPSGSFSWLWLRLILLSGHVSLALEVSVPGLSAASWSQRPKAPKPQKSTLEVWPGNGEKTRERSGRHRLRVARRRVLIEALGWRIPPLEVFQCLLSAEDAWSLDPTVGRDQAPRPGVLLGLSLSLSLCSRDFPAGGCPWRMSRP